MVKTATVSKTAVVCKDWEGAEARLLELGFLRRRMAQQEGAMNDRLTEIRAEFEPGLTGLQAEIKEIEDGLERFARERRKEFDGQSKKLFFGVFKFRKCAPAAEISDEEKTLELIEKCFNDDLAKQLIDRKPRLVKDALKKLGEKSLALIGVKVTQAETFRIEIKEDRVEEELKKRGQA